MNFTDDNLVSSNDAKTNEEYKSNGSEELRSRLRMAKLSHREKKREFLMRKLRFVEDLTPIENLSHEQFIELAEKLKRRSQTSCEVLHAIMNTLLSNEENIDIFLNVDGALQGLLRCLSGQNEILQLMAAQCICNLALGNEKSALQTLKASDSYLFVHLSGKNQYVQETCVSALGNFCRHGEKLIQLLLVQGFFPKIPQLLINADDSLESSCIYCLNQIIYHGFDILREEDLQCTLEFIIPLFQKKQSLVIFLLSLLSISKCSFPVLHINNIHVQALQQLLTSLENNDEKAVFYLRVVNNCFCQSSGEMAMDLMEKCNFLLKKCIKLLLESDIGYLKKECLGFIGVLINHSLHSIKEFGLEVLDENLVNAETYMKSSRLNEVNEIMT